MFSKFFKNKPAKTEPANDFAFITDRVQSFLDAGGSSLKAAEDKTVQLEKIDETSAEYSKIFSEVKVAQEMARKAFDEADILMQKVNGILQKKAS